MSRLFIGILFVAVWPFGLARSQVKPTYSGHVSVALAKEWKDIDYKPAVGILPVLDCLLALELYTHSPAHNDLALFLLKQGIPAPPAAAPAPVDNRIFLEPAQRHFGTLRDLLAEATSLKPGTDKFAVDSLFNTADKSIAAAFLKDPLKFDPLKDDLDRGDYPRALFHLLLTELPGIVTYVQAGSPAAPATAPLTDAERKAAEARASAKKAAASMEKYRTCYSIDPGRLFNLVRSHLQ